ncbi:hypothetical protein MVEN_00855000 [Mycena venus]|uniref:Uncharacterized protein n=1 Tax=Mycena venus TaxID=2733690 RepID=A0A8H6YGE5_9AGAR|nr:hypothetical protein MVEN_00855000 [Mycena venus]
MLPAASFHNIPLSTSFNIDQECSVISLDWVLSSGVPASNSLACGLLSLPCGDGSFRSMNVQLAIKASLPCDLVLGRDWKLYCSNAFPNTRFVMDSEYVHIHPPASTTTRASDDSEMNIDGQVLSDGPFSCLCQDPSAPLCASTSNAVHGHVPKPSTSSRNILRDIFTAHYCTHSLSTGIDSSSRLGACFEHKLDVHPNSKIDRSTCAVIAEEFESASSITAAVLDIILTAEHKKISAEHLCHVAAALDIIPTGSRNLRFKVRASLRKRGTYFNHVKAMMPQRDYKDEDGDLIAPHENPKFLDSKIYHVNVEKLTILDPGNGPAWDPEIPTLPGTAPSTPSTSRIRQRDAAVDDAFDDASPSKRPRSG